METLSQYEGPLNISFTKDMDTVISELYSSKDEIGRCFHELYNKIEDADQLIFAARQGVVLIKPLQSLFNKMGKPFPKFSIISTSNKLSSAFDPVPLEEEIGQLSQDIFMSYSPGKKFIIDEISHAGVTQERLLKLSKILDPESYYEFVNLLSPKEDRQKAMWDLPVESTKHFPDDDILISISRFLHMQHALKLKNVSPEEMRMVNVTLPVENPLHQSLIAASILDTVLEDIVLSYNP